jgi:co-chaperonin GroES (HSP10)
VKLCDDSKYLKPFTEAKKSCDGEMYLTGDVLLVEKVTGQEHSKEITREDGTRTKLYLTGGAEKKVDGLDMNLPMFVRVLAVGPGFFDEAQEKAINCEVEVGDIILIGRMSVNWFSVFGGVISEGSHEVGITRESEVRMRFKGDAAYKKFFKALNEELAYNGQKEKAVQPHSQNSNPA